MDFSNKNLWPFFRLGDFSIYITKTLVSTWFVMAALIIAAIALRLMIDVNSNSTPKAGSIQNIVEFLVEMMSGFAESNLGKDLSWLGGYFFGVFAFILISNYSALFGFRPPTADLSTTLALALNTFFLIHFLGISRRGLAYFKDYLHPIFFFLPMNIIGELSKPLSLSFRLFGNILGGFILLGMVYHALPLIFRFALPDALHAYFDIFAGSLQAFIFSVLSMTFIKEKASPEKE
ncbi:MAG: F0F1 ATP synthase subunit A [Clostridiales bacterium]|jgi:F-type H+-transporting ATPase subunit a|nr:F0F1 ATP synthase subunit A [Clostridiales bacterium]